MNSAKPPLPLQDVKDFLHRLSTESKKVVLLFSDVNSGISASLAGKLEIGKDGEFVIVHSLPSGPVVDPLKELSSFRLLLPILLSFPCVFADPRELDGSPFAAFLAGGMRFSFAIIFALPAGFLALMEFDE
jgi:hypothetical protein